MTEEASPDDACSSAAPAAVHVSRTDCSTTFTLDATETEWLATVIRDGLATAALPDAARELLDTIAGELAAATSTPDDASDAGHLPSEPRTPAVTPTDESALPEDQLGPPEQESGSDSVPVGLPLAVEQDSPPGRSLLETTAACLADRTEYRLSKNTLRPQTVIINRDSHPDGTASRPQQALAAIDITSTHPAPHLVVDLEADREARERLLDAAERAVIDAHSEVLGIDSFEALGITWTPETAWRVTGDLSLNDEPEEGQR